VPEMEQTSELVQIDRLALAAWLRMNGEELLERRLEDDARMIYVFRRSPDTRRLIKQWEEKTPREAALAKFSRIVSFEIRKAIHMRRAAGLSPRLRSVEKS
jgi:hypothetical protein